MQDKGRQVPFIEIERNSPLMKNQLQNRIWILLSLTIQSKFQKAKVYLKIQKATLIQDLKINIIYNISLLTNNFYIRKSITFQTVNIILFPIIIFNLDNFIMYNSYLADKVAREKDDKKRKQNSIKHWVDNYYQKVRPHLLVKYNKRINSFIRKMEEHPIIMKAQQSQLSNMQKLFRNVYEKDSFIGDKSFKFKDSDDWKSFYTPGQRLQRQKNMKIFKDKFGDADIAFRSIGSQSAYVSSANKQFRVRQKNKQINPPMKYTTKSFNNRMARTNYKLKKNTQIDPQFEQLNKKNTSSSIGNFLQDDLHSQNFSIRQHSLKAESVIDNDDDENIEMIKQKQLQNDDKKMHFKRMIDIQQTVTDIKTKKSLREILVKCGVYRNKGKRAVTEVQDDKFQQLQK